MKLFLYQYLVLQTLCVLALFNFAYAKETRQIADSQLNTVQSETTEDKTPVVEELTEYQKQQKILEQFKPLIKPRTYDDLILVSEPQPKLLLNRLPELNEAIVPGRAPNMKVIPYLLKSFAHPAYEARFQGVQYEIAVNCEDPRSFDDCSTTPHNRFAHKEVYVRFIQSSDVKFSGVKGMRVGQQFGEVSHLFSDSAAIHGDGECLESNDGWLVCFDAKQLAVNKRRLQMMPRSDARLLRFLKIGGRGY